jgi:hypothetical protein
VHYLATSDSSCDQTSIIIANQNPEDMVSTIHSFHL